ncbi:hypothetical protein IQ289_18870 [Burkholderia sp. R-70006]|uniref:hypothetical protein n=1 Tax=Paraburkholderia domus TaxID=2793075 RepID=UPI001914C48B|nr:hypothetical protein [Paraburkholderia domus]MBK5050459.1 hypothetical protein [Burkholderia sp. R-70006]
MNFGCPAKKASIYRAIVTPSPSITAHQRRRRKIRTVNGQADDRPDTMRMRGFRGTPCQPLTGIVPDLRLRYRRRAKRLDHTRMPQSFIERVLKYIG